LSSASEPQQSEIATFDPSVVPEEKQEFELAVLADTASDPDARSTEPLPAAAPAKPIAGEIQTSNAQENAPGSEQTASVETVVTFDTTVKPSEDEAQNEVMAENAAPATGEDTDSAQPERIAHAVKHANMR